MSDYITWCDDHTIERHFEKQKKLKEENTCGKNAKHRNFSDPILFLAQYNIAMEKNICKRVLEKAICKKKELYLRAVPVGELYGNFFISNAMI